MVHGSCHSPEVQLALEYLKRRIDFILRSCSEETGLGTRELTAAPNRSCSKEDGAGVGKILTSSGNQRMGPRLCRRLRCPNRLLQDNKPVVQI